MLFPIFNLLQPRSLLKHQKWPFSDDGSSKCRAWNFFRDFGDVTLVQNLFKQIRAINRTNSRPIWTPTCEDIDHIAKMPWNIPPKKKSPMFLTFLSLQKIEFISLTFFSMKEIQMMFLSFFSLQKNRIMFFEIFQLEEHSNGVFELY